MKYALNLAGEPFARYRAVNIALTFVLVLAAGLAAFSARVYLRFAAGVAELEAVESEHRVEWESLGSQISELERRFSQPQARAQIEEVQFLSQTVERKRFSWTALLDEIEGVIPPNVYLVGLEPEIGEEGQVYISMEARGQTIDDLSEFIAGLEQTEAFRDVVVTIEERGFVQGRPEIRVVMGAAYIRPARDSGMMQ